MRIDEQKILEELSTLEHEQWMKWAKELVQNESISEEIKNRWKKYFIPYVDLPEEIKELDRPFARKNLEIFKKYIKETK